MKSNDTYYNMDGPENVMLRERSQTQKTTYCMVPFIGNFRIGKSIELESRLMVFSGWGVWGK